MDDIVLNAILNENGEVVTYCSGVWSGQTPPSKPQHIRTLQVTIDKTMLSDGAKQQFFSQLLRERAAKTPIPRPMASLSCL